MRSDSWQIEKNFIPETLEDLVELQRALEDCGASHQDALAIPAWIVAKKGGRDVIGSSTRSRYRKVLSSLNGHYHGRPPRRRGVVTPPLLRRRRSRGPTLQEAA